MRIAEDSSKRSLVSFLGKKPKSRTISVIVFLNENYGNDFPETGSQEHLLSVLLRESDQAELYNAIREVFKLKFSLAKPEPFSLLPKGFFDLPIKADNEE